MFAPSLPNDHARPSQVEAQNKRDGTVAGLSRTCVTGHEDLVDLDSTTRKHHHESVRSALGWGGFFVLLTLNKSKNSIIKTSQDHLSTYQDLFDMGSVDGPSVSPHLHRRGGQCLAKDKHWDKRLLHQRCVVQAVSWRCLPLVERCLALQQWHQHHIAISARR